MEIKAKKEAPTGQAQTDRHKSQQPSRQPGEQRERGSVRLGCFTGGVVHDGIALGACFRCRSKENQGLDLTGLD